MLSLLEAGLPVQSRVHPDELIWKDRPGGAILRGIKTEGSRDSRAG